MIELAPDGNVGYQFGVSVAVRGGLVVVVARFADLAYIFSDTGRLIQKLAGPSGNQFGISVDVSGSIIVIGGPGDDGLRGAAYVYRCPGPCPDGSWSQQQKLTAMDKAPGDQFGSAVAISGNTIVAGALVADIAGKPDQGAAYVFQCSAPCTGASWDQKPKLIASDGAASDMFGVSVAVADGKIVVGASGDDSRKGSAYIFESIGGEWAETRKLIPCTATVNDLFGSSVGISGNAVLAGAPGDRRLNPGNALTTPGSAYVFELDDIVCLTDDKTGDVLRVNLTTGAYKYTRCRSSLDLFTSPGDRFGCVFNLSDPFRLNCDQMTGTFRISSECGVYCCTYTLTEHTPFGKPIVIASITRCSFFPSTTTVTGNAKTMFSRRFGTGFSIQDTQDKSTCCCR